jgi:hypothetical protein
VLTAAESTAEAKASPTGLGFNPAQPHLDATNAVVLPTAEVTRYLDTHLTKLGLVRALQPR